MLFACCVGGRSICSFGVGEIMPLSREDGQLKRTIKGRTARTETQNTSWMQLCCEEKQNQFTGGGQVEKSSKSAGCLKVG